ncbi:Uu.00g047430.m01.CDS01 [Anthostomella pinea]|uniref:Uu.00g047430.m01.CDS01 n=1 Tax=Anthostomella pinea TaxID=933095 RepID=A0AAI8VBI7_9PEZI|nr:Uu.00g047430.m01.CDS01 [Anthostomella pinea]
MPGSSLWLVPPPSHPLRDILSTLINMTLPARFPELTRVSFSPHVTLTSNVPPSRYGDKPLDWLDAVPWPSADEVRVCFGDVRTEDVFFRRCYVKVGFEGVKKVAGIGRAGDASIDDHTLQEIRDVVREAGVRLDGLGSGDREGFGGWEGGEVWLVPTDRPVEGWKPIAVKTL